MHRKGEKGAVLRSFSPTSIIPSLDVDLPGGIKSVSGITCRAQRCSRKSQGVSGMLGGFQRGSNESLWSLKGSEGYSRRPWDVLERDLEVLKAFQEVSGNSGGL